MRKFIYFIVVVLSIHIYGFPCRAADLLKQYDKVILIDQIRQIGKAYEDGKEVCEFPVITGDDETPTPPGIYIVQKKDANYFSHTYQTPMPYSIFFDFRGKRAIHEGEVPPPNLRKDLATHGCIHVEEPYIKWLYNWAVVGKTAVIIYGWRTGA